MLRFHRAHGRNIELTENRRTAIRVESFANALVFSHRPLERNELFLIEIQDQAIGWAGNIRCGITLHNPGSIQIPQYLFPDLQKMGKSYVFALKPVIDDPFNDMETNMKIVNWNNRTLCAERNGNKNVETVIRRCEKMKYCDKFNKKLLALDPLCNPCGINSRIGFFVSPKGELYFLINGQQFGPCVQNIPTRSNIYAVVDLYGATKQVQILNCGVPSLSMFCKNLLWQSYTEEELDDELQEACLPKTLKMELKEFYASHGMDGGFGDWSSYSSCSKTCGGGFQTRTRKCNNPTPVGSGKDCAGSLEETRSCANDFCEGLTGVAKAQALVEKFLKNFHKTEYPNKTPSGKFYKAIFDIQKVVAEEFIPVARSAKGKTVEERLKDLESFLKVATEGASFNFARATLGRGLFTFLKKSIINGLQSDEMVKAAYVYLKRIKNKIGEQNFNQIIPSQRDSTLMFVMDTTGSMGEEIIVSKLIAKSIIKTTLNFKDDYILSPFSDPETGPVTYKGEKERAGFITAISNLRAEGGGDCPELAIKGMLNALDQGPKYGSPMFVFTDATAKDDSAENMEALKSAADMNSATITFFTNTADCARAGKIGNDSYKEIALHTSGQIFPLVKEATLSEIQGYVASSLRLDTKISSASTTKSRSKRAAEDRRHVSYEFSVDDETSELIVSVPTEDFETAEDIELKDPFGKTVTISDTMSKIRIFQIENPRSGVYTVKFPLEAEKNEYTAEAVSKDAIAFAYNFMYQENPRKESPPFSLYNPITGVENQMIIRLGGVHRIDMNTIRVDLVDLHGKVLLSNLKLSDLDADNRVLSTMLTPPTESFRVRLTGKTKTGAPFERISRGVSKVSNVFLQPIFAGDEFTVTSGQRNVAVQVKALVFGSSQSQPLTFTAKARRGSITRTASKNIRKMGYVKLIYNAPSGMEGKTETIRVTVTNPRTGEKSTKIFLILLK